MYLEPPFFNDSREQEPPFSRPPEAFNRPQKALKRTEKRVEEAIDVVVRGVRATAERYLVRSRRNLNARIAVDVKRDLDKR